MSRRIDAIKTWNATPERWAIIEECVVFRDRRAFRLHPRSATDETFRTARAVRHRSRNGFTLNELTFLERIARVRCGGRVRSRDRYRSVLTASAQMHGHRLERRMDLLPGREGQLLGGARRQRSDQRCVVDVHRHARERA